MLLLGSLMVEKAIIRIPEDWVLVLSLPLAGFMILNKSLPRLWNSPCLWNKLHHSPVGNCWTNVLGPFFPPCDKGHKSSLKVNSSFILARKQTFLLVAKWQDLQANSGALCEVCHLVFVRVSVYTFCTSVKSLKKTMPWSLLR